MQTLTPESLQAKLNSNTETVLIDVREDWEYELCHIEGSRHLPMNQVAATMGTLDKEAETVVICHHGIRSQQVAQYLESQGFKNIYNLGGGIDTWAKTIDPDMAQY